MACESSPRFLGGSGGAEAGHVGALLVLGEADGVAARGAQTGLQVRVAAGGVAADRTLVPAIFITFIQVFMLQAPFIFNMDVGVEFPRQRLVQLHTDKLNPDTCDHTARSTASGSDVLKAEFLQAELTSSSHWRCLSLRAISSGVSPASLAGAKTTVTIITVSPRRTWMREKMSRAFTASHSVWSRDVASELFFLAKRFSVYLAVMKSFLACLVEHPYKPHNAPLIVANTTWRLNAEERNHDWKHLLPPVPQAVNLYTKR
ncbi:hypothetical protein EYF80_009579 [Liparis tanakae]|uniref:Uncharacterized protein n=1 Tax=Liparis tanakae TaxID=230148 RepID=A0A4Z2IRU6_9TELE|nr:hypothetical protein EYF80_009579 [Liparis tanakae]